MVGSHEVGRLAGRDPQRSSHWKTLSVGIDQLHGRRESLVHLVAEADQGGRDRPLECTSRRHESVLYEAIRTWDERRSVGEGHGRGPAAEVELLVVGHGSEDLRTQRSAGSLRLWLRRGVQPVGLPERRDVSNRTKVTLLRRPRQVSLPYCFLSLLA